MDYKINIDFLVYKKMSLYIKYADGEISGLAKVERDETNREIFNITDIVLLEQKCSSASTTLQDDSIAKFYDGLLKNGEDMSKWRCWWHSHANFGVFWSGTDDSTIEALNPESSTDNLILSIVANKKEEILARIDSFEPLRVTLDKVTTDITFTDEDLETQCKAEVETKVKPNIITTVEYNYNRPVTKFERDELYEYKYNSYSPDYITGGVDVLPSQYIDSTGVYVLGKDEMYHKKLKKLSKEEKRQMHQAFQDEQKELAEIKKFTIQNIDIDKDLAELDKLERRPYYE